MSTRRSTESGFVQAVILLSTLTTARDVWMAEQERRAGRDAAEQERRDVAVPMAREAVVQVQELALLLRAGHVHTLHRGDEDPAAALVRRFEEIVTLNRLARVLHVLHQRMMSLYPAVPAELIETVRLVQFTCSKLIDDGDDELSRLGPFIERLFHLSTDVFLALS